MVLLRGDAFRRDLKRLRDRRGHTGMTEAPPQGKPLFSSTGELDVNLIASSEKRPTAKPAPVPSPHPCERRSCADEQRARGSVRAARVRYWAALTKCWPAARGLD